MSKNKIKALLFFLCSLTIFSACGSENDAIKQKENFLNLDKEEKINLNDYSLEYQSKTDAQSFFEQNVTKSENGYYFWDEMGIEGLGLMMFYDVKSGQCIPLCNRPNCNHNNTECNAYFNANITENDYFDRNYIQYYEGSIYVVGYDKKDNVNLYKVAADGSSWETYMQLYRADMSSASEEDSNIKEWITPEVCIHRGYVYYIDNKESSLKIRRMKMGGSDIEVIYESTGNQALLYSMKAYGDYLFFKTGNVIDGNEIKVEAGIVAYNTLTGELFSVKQNVINSYVVENNNIYYISGTEIRKFSLLTQEDKLLFDSKMQDINFSMDNQYVYIYNWDTNMVTVYDYEGNEICVVDGIISDCYFGDTEYLFASASNNGEPCKAILDLSEIKDGEGKWKYINLDGE